MARFVRCSRSGFTLIELLVSVSIMGILASLLLPALGRARERGRRAACISNLHQIGLAAMAYTEDWQGKFPALQSTAAEPWRWAGNLIFNWEGTTRPLNSYLGIKRVTYSSAMTPFAPDIQSVVRCPSDNMNWAPGTGTHYFSLGSSYFYNAYGKGIGGLNGLKGLEVTKVRNPSEVVLACDWTYDVSFALASYGNVYVKGPHELGTTWGHAVFVDGHVSWIHFSETATQFWQGDGWTMIAQ